MIKNYFFLGAGILALVGAIGHAVTGHQGILPQVETLDLRHTVFLFLHQTTWFMLASSGFLLLTSLSSRPSRFTKGAWFIAIVFGGNFVVFILSSLVMNTGALSQLPPQLLFVVLYLGLIVIGIKRSSRFPESEAVSE